VRCNLAIVHYSYGSVRIKYNILILIHTGEEFDKIADVFGIVNYSFATVCDHNIDSIKKNVDEFIMNFDSNTKFRVSTTRSYKKFPMTSTELDIEIGAYIVEKSGAKVSLKKFDKETRNKSRNSACDKE